MHRIVQHLTLLPALFSVAVCAQEPAVLPVRVPLPLAFSLVPPPPFLLDSRIAADTLTVQRSNDGWGSLGMNLFRWRSGDPMPPIASPYTSSFYAVVPFDLDVRQVTVKWPSAAAVAGEGVTRTAFDERAAALRALAASAVTYETGTWQTPPSEPTSNWGVSVGASNYDPWGVYGNHRYRSDCALGLGFPPWGCR
jgi:hypothetical protein